MDIVAIIFALIILVNVAAIFVSRHYNREDD